LNFSTETCIFVQLNELNKEIKMVEITSLWLPILLSAVFVFILSSLIHMVIPWHKGDFKQLENEDGVMDALRPLSIKPGDYMVPCPTGRDAMKSGEFKNKLEKGPVMMMTVYPGGKQSMGGKFIMWFLYSIVIGIFAAYVTSRALPAGVHYLQVFRFAGVSAFMCYSVALWQQSIWYGRSWVTTLKITIDALLYAFLTAGTFGWLWPK
jgi:hypothetical protein